MPFITISWSGQPTRIEYDWVGEPRTAALSDKPVLVFLHEGLGSLAMWRDFPAQLCASLGCAGLVYSRPAYGKSTARAVGEQWQPNFLARQATEVLPTLLDALQLTQPVALFGHSDGGSIALLFAAHYPERVISAVVCAPHIMVEDISIASIAQAKQAFLTTDLPQKLARYHDDVDSAFWGWNDVWLSPAFRNWTIADQLAHIRCPLLAVQGVDDEYGTMAQIDGIAQRVPHTTLLKLAQCGHSPHKDKASELILAVTTFYKNHPLGDKP